MYSYNKNHSKQKGDKIMNTYLVPTTDEFGKKFINIMVVYAESQKDAYKKAEMRKGLASFTIQKYTDKSYETFYKEIPFTTKYFSMSRKNAILKEIFAKDGIEYMETIRLYDYMYWGNYNVQVQSLADKAIKEPWSFEGSSNNYILKNYLENTFDHLQREHKVIELMNIVCSIQVYLQNVTYRFMHMVKSIQNHW